MNSVSNRAESIHGRADQLRRASSWAAAAMLFAFSCVGTSRAANTIAAFQGQTTTGTAAFTVDNASGDYPIVTYILSQPIGPQPGGVNFTRYVFLAQDSTGS